MTWLSSVLPTLTIGPMNGRGGLTVLTIMVAQAAPPTAMAMMTKCLATSQICQVCSSPFRMSALSLTSALSVASAMTQGPRNGVTFVVAVSMLNACWSCLTTKAWAAKLAFSFPMVSAGGHPRCPATPLTTTMVSLSNRQTLENRRRLMNLGHEGPESDVEEHFADFSSTPTSSSDPERDVDHILCGRTVPEFLIDEPMISLRPRLSELHVVV